MKKHPHARGEDDNHGNENGPKEETPPRTWGRRCSLQENARYFRNTPTHVGKTCAPFRRERSRQKHPHARGEDSSTVNQVFVPFETPPRTWGRQGLSVAFLYATRNTPTHVGKTLPLREMQLQFWKHPTHVGKTDVPGPVDFTLRKHPHARGEDAAKKKLPRITTGNTPTHVGKTALKASGVTRWGKHPHARGEDQPRYRDCQSRMETPPRTWGRHSRTRLAQ